MSIYHDCCLEPFQVAKKPFDFSTSQVPSHIPDRQITNILPGVFGITSTYCIGSQTHTWHIEINT